MFNNQISSVNTFEDHYDLVGLETGPFNLSVAALSSATSLKSIFF